jgi:hypothetical protein
VALGRTLGRRAGIGLQLKRSVGKGADCLSGCGLPW